jgi:hypothetical protein
VNVPIGSNLADIQSIQAAAAAAAVAEAAGDDESDEDVGPHPANIEAGAGGDSDAGGGEDTEGAGDGAGAGDGDIEMDSGVDARGLASSVRALSPEDAECRQNGAWALCNLCSDCDEAGRMIVENGAIAPLVLLLDGNAECKRNASDLLWNLSWGGFVKDDKQVRPAPLLIACQYRQSIARRYPPPLCRCTCVLR